MRYCNKSSINSIFKAKGSIWYPNCTSVQFIIVFLLRRTIFFRFHGFCLENWPIIGFVPQFRKGSLTENPGRATGCIVVLNKHRNEDKQHSLHL